MKTEELMIGDWVKTNPNGGKLTCGIKSNIAMVSEIGFSNSDGMYVSFVGINGRYYDNELEPIPLTSEILEKNGFKEDSKTNGIYWRPDCRKFCIVKELDTWYFAFRILGKTVDKSSGYICISECNYVHKLQHILKDLEIEKEIVL